MGCAGCGSKYRRISGATRQRLILPPSKYTGRRKPSKQPAAPVAPATPKKINPETAIGLMANIANSIQ